VFLPRWETTAFSTIGGNSLIQSGDGLILIVAAVLAADALYRDSARDRGSWWPALIGAAMLGVVL
jgi:hypothetical protein